MFVFTLKSEGLSSRYIDSAMFAHGSVSLQMFWVLWIFLRSLGVICYDRWILSEDHKLFRRLVFHELTAYLSIFNLFKVSELPPYYQKHVNQTILNNVTLKLSFTNIWSLHKNFVHCESFLELKSPSMWDKPGWLNWFCQFLCERLSYSNPKGF